MNRSINRRSALQRLTTAAAAVGAVSALPRISTAAEKSDFYTAKARRIRQSVIYWCFKPMPVEELAQAAARMGIKSVELVPSELWPTLKKLGLICAMTPSHGFAKGFAHKEEHEECLATLRKRIDESADAGFPNVITFSGFRRGISDDDGMRNMVEGLKQIV